jgi:magnesium transporter
VAAAKPVPHPAETYAGGVARTRCYRNGILVAEDFPAEDISEHLEEPGSVVWLDLCAPGVDDLELVRSELGIHDLAIEDAVHHHERPKLDRYSTHAFLSAYGVRVEAGSAQLVTSEVSAFITSDALITIRKDEGFDIQAVVDRWDASGDLAKYGVSFLLYGLIDYVVDGHFDAVQNLDEAIENLEDLLFDERTQGTAVQRRSFDVRKSLVLLRRVVLPMREVVNSLLRRDLHIVPEEMTPYYQDVYDHVLRATEWTESLRDLVSTILDTNLTIQSNRLNVITKKVTSWAAIIAVPTAITGFYGQNLPFPGFAKTWGFVVSSVLIVLASVVLYAAFRSKDWL